MIGGMIVFILGTLFGSGAFIAVYRMFMVQIEKLRRRNEKLLETIYKDRVKHEFTRAYRKGYYEGEKHIKAGDADG